jgi:hypothetical protein
VGEGNRKAPLEIGRDKETGAYITGDIRLLNRLVDVAEGDKCGRDEPVDARLRDIAV